MLHLVGIREFGDIVVLGLTLVDKVLDCLLGLGCHDVDMVLPQQMSMEGLRTLAAVLVRAGRLSMNPAAYMTCQTGTISSWKVS